jgi:hypothetical protein
LEKQDSDDDDEEGSGSSDGEDKKPWLALEEDNEFPKPCKCCRSHFK